MLIWVKIAAGGVHLALRLSPQHTTVPSLRSAHVCEPPATSDCNVGSEPAPGASGLRSGAPASELPAPSIPGAASARAGPPSRAASPTHVEVLFAPKTQRFVPKQVPRISFVDRLQHGCPPPPQGWQVYEGVMQVVPVAVQKRPAPDPMQQVCPSP